MKGYTELMLNRDKSLSVSEAGLAVQEWPRMELEISNPSSTLETYDCDLLAYFDSCKGQIPFDAHTKNITTLLRRAHSEKKVHNKDGESEEPNAMRDLQVYSTYHRQDRQPHCSGMGSQQLLLVLVGQVAHNGKAERI